MLTLGGQKAASLLSLIALQEKLATGLRVISIR
jgi:hypothetical protein